MKTVPVNTVTRVADPPPIPTKVWTRNDEAWVRLARRIREKLEERGELVVRPRPWLERINLAEMEP